MRTIGKVARTANISGKNWRKEWYVFLSSYRATPHSSTKKPLYQLLMNRYVRIKLPEITLDKFLSVTNQEVHTNDQKSKAKMKKYADESRHAKRHCLKIGIGCTKEKEQA